MLLNAYKDLNSCEWCFADDDKTRFSKAFSIDFSSKKPKEWKIFVSEFLGLEQMIKICQEACNSDFITIECDEKDEESLKKNLKSIMDYVVNLSEITCFDDEMKGFMVIGENLSDKCWEVQINC